MMRAAGVLAQGMVMAAAERSAVAGEDLYPRSEEWWINVVGQVPFPLRDDVEQVARYQWTSEARGAYHLWLHLGHGRFKQQDR
jgi:hypothetical protein